MATELRDLCAPSWPDGGGRVAALQQRVAEILVAAPPVQEAAEQVIVATCECLGWDAGAVWLVEDGKQSLRCAAAHALDSGAEGFLQATRELRFGPGVGLPGRILESGAPAWIADIARDPNFPRREHALQAGLRAAVGYPIMHGGRCLGVLEAVRRSQLPAPDERRDEVIAVVTAQLAQIVACGQAEEELERSNEELECFAEIASHDLAAPVRILCGFGELLKEHLSRADDEQGTQYLEAMLRRTAQVEQIIEGLLSFTRGTWGALHWRAVDSRALVDDALDTLGPMIEKVGAVVTVDDLPTVFGDARQLAQVFHNLLDNALKFRDEQSPSIHVSAERRPRAWCFAVADNGIGVDPADAEQIFRRFTRGRTGRGYQGTGIGLATCRRIVERHGGVVWVESAAGEGSTFCFTLPDAPPAPDTGIAAGGRMPSERRRPTMS